MRILIKILTLIELGITLNSCFEDPNCVNKNNLVGISFKKMWKGKADTVSIRNIRLTGTDSIFNEVEAKIGLELPLNTTASQQVLDFDLFNYGKQSITVSYITRMQFESPDCKLRVVFLNLDIIQHTFDSVRVVNNVPQATVTTSNIDIYRCPFTNQVKIQFRQLFADTVSAGIPLKEKLNGVDPTYAPIRFFADTEVSVVTLPLDLTSNSTTFVFDSKDNGSERLTLDYDQQANTLFEACGSQNFIYNLKLSSSDFDITEIIVDSVYDPPTTNVQLFRCPQTNLIELGLRSSDTQNVNVPFQITEVTADYTSRKFYQDSLTAVLVLPLDISKDQTDFNIVFEGVAKDISVGYVRTSEQFHQECNQTLISDISVIASDFATAPVVVADSLQFPTVTNIAIINN